MKKIGILFGQENTFPWAFIERVNEKKVKGVVAEAVSIDKVMQGATSEYAVIIDRISQDVPFYRAMLKNAAISGTAVINNPFWWSADEKFFNNALAVNIGVPVPNTVLLPSKEMPDDTNANSFRNLKYPLDWDSIFKYVGFPAYMKPHAGGGWKSVYKIHNMEDFFEKYAETGQLVMMLQSEVVFDQYYRCYCLGGKYVHIMPYEPRNPHHLRYVASWEESPAILAKIQEYVLKLCRGLGYDFNTVEFGVSNGVPYAIDFCNPAPDAELSSVGQENFNWIVENASNYAIERALSHKEGKDNLTWGSFIKYAACGGSMIPDVSVKATPSVKTATKSTTITKVEKIVATKPKVEKKAAAPKVEKKTSAPMVEKKAATPKIEKKVVASTKDDLKKIEGIGPKIEELLNKANILTFNDLSKSKADNIKEILLAAGSRYQMHDPTSWPNQAKLAADGKWDALKKLQGELTGGKRK